MLYQEISSQIIGCAYEVHHHLGFGFLEVCYKKAMLFECQTRGLQLKTEFPLAVTYKGQDIGHYFADLFVEEKILVELKAVKSLLPIHQAQIINYLNASKVKLGLLINFGSSKLEVKRLVV